MSDRRRRAVDWHRLLASYLDGRPFDLRRDSASEDDLQRAARGVAELPYHLTCAEDWDRLEQVLCNLEFVEAKVRAGSVVQLVADYALVGLRLPENRARRESERRRQERLERYVRELREYAAGRSAVLDVIPSIRPAELQAAHEAEGRLSDDPDRPERFRAFEDFVRRYARSFVRFGHHPRFVIQQAYNDADGGPVAAAAAPILANETHAAHAIVASSARRRYQPWDASRESMPGHGFTSAVAVSADGATGASVGTDGFLRLWDLTARRQVGCVSQSAERLCLSADATTVVTAGPSFDVNAYFIDTSERAGPLKGHTGGIRALCVDATGRLALSGCSRGWLRVWDLRLQKCVHELRVSSEEVCAIGVSADGSIGVTGDGRGRIEVWDLKAGARLRTLAERLGRVSHIDVSPDGRLAVSASSTGAQVWDLRSGSLLGGLAGSENERIRTAHLSADARVAVGSNRGTGLFVWALPGGQLLARLAGTRSPTWESAPMAASR